MRSLLRLTVDIGPAAGEGIAPELRPPLQPVRGGLHPGALEQVPAQRLGGIRGLRAAGVSRGSSSRDHNSVRLAAITVQAAQCSMRGGSMRAPGPAPAAVAIGSASRSARAAVIALANASISAAIDSRARSIFCARTISSSQSSGPAKPSTASTGAAAWVPRAWRILPGGDRRFGNRAVAGRVVRSRHGVA